MIAGMREKGVQVSFISVFMGEDEKKGWTGYNCFLRASQMKYKVDDYLMVSDDTMLYTWNLENLDRNKIWKSPYHQWSSTKTKKLMKHWLKDRVTLNAAFAELKKKYGNSAIVNDLTYDKLCLL